jgi:hypothetical protein
VAAITSAHETSLKSAKSLVAIVLHYHPPGGKIRQAQMRPVCSAPDGGIETAFLVGHPPNLAALPAGIGVGFPSEVVDDPLLSLVSPEQELFSLPAPPPARVCHAGQPDQRTQMRMLEEWAETDLFDRRSHPVAQRRRAGTGG